MTRQQLLDSGATRREVERADEGGELIPVHAIEVPRHPDHLTDLPNAKGAAELRRVLHGDTKFILSRLEAKFIALLTQHVLPLPDTSRKAGAQYVDCRWPLGLAGRGRGACRDVA